jgi:hypothetical protein
MDLLQKLGLQSKPVPKKKEHIAVKLDAPSKSKPLQGVGTGTIDTGDDKTLTTTLYKPTQPFIKKIDDDIKGQALMDKFKMIKAYKQTGMEQKLPPVLDSDEDDDDDFDLDAPVKKTFDMPKPQKEKDIDGIVALPIKDNFPYMKYDVPKDALRRLADLEITDKQRTEKLVLENYNNLVRLNRITSKFSEKARMKCKHSKSPSNMSPHDYYLANKVKFDEQLKRIHKIKDKALRRDERKQIYKQILKETKECTYFNPSRVIYIMKFLFGNNKAALRKLRWLDMSAGWGDRLIGAIALGMSYHGVDPSVTMKSVYEHIINTFVPDKNKGKYKIENLPFEDVEELNEEYDVAFTSPPFFDFEVYDDSNEIQSHKRYPTIEEWTHKFIVPYATKAWRAVKQGGYLVLYIEDKGGEYVKEITKAIGFEPEILYLGYDDVDVTKARKTYIWKKKVDMTASLPKTSVSSVDETSESVVDGEEEVEESEEGEESKMKEDSIDDEDEEEEDEDDEDDKVEFQDEEEEVDEESEEGEETSITQEKTPEVTKESVIESLRHECPPGKIKNPKTGRCVKEDGTAGKKIIQEALEDAGLLSTDKPDVPIPEALPQPVLDEETIQQVAGKTMEELVKELQNGCPPGKVKNPKTGRCVAESGAVGKAIIKAAAEAANITFKPKQGVKPGKKETVITPFKDVYEKISSILVNGQSIVEPKENLKMVVAPSYFQNNREVFIREINKLFKKYKQDIIEQEKEKPSCNARKEKNSSFSLMTHQQIVQDYIHHMSPYRGLLIYHGLGSGKTCSSIAIAEGLKYRKKVYVMTPASIRSNYIKELKNCGDALYTTNHNWVFINKNDVKYRAHIKNICSKYNVDYAFVMKNGGVWVTLNDPSKESNYDELTQEQRTSLQAQIDNMIKQKYQFINYNGIRESGLDKLIETRATQIGRVGDTNVNPFDHSVVVIDEAHNFISRIVNKISKNKKASLSYRFYELLMDADDCRIVFLTGTPIINYPNEMGVIFNILRGYIKTFEIPLKIPADVRASKDSIRNLLKKDHSLDYMDYEKGVLTVTMNPYSFTNKYSRSGEYKGVKNMEKKGSIVTNKEFLDNINHILSNKRISFKPEEVVLKKHTLLPDTHAEFNELFMNSSTMTPINQMLMKQRIIGLTSYYRSAQESLLPRYNEMNDLKIVSIPMSDYQFGIYEEIRVQERNQEKNNAKKKKKQKDDGIFDDVVSTYRIFSRAACNFVFPEDIPRPMPKDGENVETAIQDGINEHELDIKPVDEVVKSEDSPYEMDDIEDLEAAKSKNVDKTYGQRIQNALDSIRLRKDEFLMGDGLNKLSPKFKAILEIIQNTSKNDDENGLHLIYSSFRNLEGIELMRMVLDANGFSQFKLRKDGNGDFIINMTEEELSKPSYMLYTGVETVEEKETMRNIYNGNWDILNETLKGQLETLSPDNKNKYGDIIKIIMITASGAEGIDLKNTRYVHIMESYWHPVRMEQVIGRARRICSHMDLEEEKQDVKVYVYLMTFTDEQKASSIDLRLKDVGKLTDQPLSSDESLHEISMIKRNITNKLLQSVKESSIDCAIHNRPGNSEELVCYRVQNPKPENFSFTPTIRPEQKDDVVKMNVKKTNKKYGKVTLKTNEHPKGKVYALKLVEKDGKFVQTKEIYDYDSYVAIKTKGLNMEPDYVGILKKDPKTKLFVIVS